MRKLPKLFNSEISLNENIITAVSKRKDIEINQDQTKNAFSEKGELVNINFFLLEYFFNSIHSFLVNSQDFQ